MKNNKIKAKVLFEKSIPPAGWLAGWLAC